MADKKISQLDAASSTDGTEVLPIVQSSTTKKLAVSKIKDYLLGVANVFTQPQTFQPSIDGQAGTFRRYSGSQTAKVLEVQTEANATLASIDKDGLLAAPNANLALGTITTDKKILDLSATWNAAGVTFTGFKLNVTDTASASGSLLLDVQKGGTSQLVLNKSGNLGLGVTSVSAFGAGFTTIQTSGSSGSGIKFNTSTVTSGYIYAEANGFYISNPTNTILRLGCNEIDRLTFGTNAAVFNEPGNDYDFRIEGDTDANLFFVDASTDRVGIGTNTPGAKLQVIGASGDTAVFGAINSASTTAIGGITLGCSTDNANRRSWGVKAESANLGTLGVWVSSNNSTSPFSGTQAFSFTSSNNLLIGGTSSPLTGTNCLSIYSGTAPTATTADSITVYSSDLSAGNTMLSVYTEGTSVSDSTDNAVTKKIAVRINGTVYYLLADTDAS